jgi:hypothetical protein
LLELVILVELPVCVEKIESLRIISSNFKVDDELSFLVNEI